MMRIPLPDLLLRKSGQDFDIVLVGKTGPRISVQTGELVFLGQTDLSLLP
jgi:hypothetical protein